MIAQSLRVADERQEQLRKEAAIERRARRDDPEPRSIVASVAALIRSALPGPSIATGTILPATH